MNDIRIRFERDETLDHTEIVIRAANSSEETDALLKSFRSLRAISCA